MAPLSFGWIIMIYPAEPICGLPCNYVHLRGSIDNQTNHVDFLVAPRSLPRTHSLLEFKRAVFTKRVGLKMRGIQTRLCNPSSDDQVHLGDRIRRLFFLDMIDSLWNSRGSVYLGPSRVGCYTIIPENKASGPDASKPWKPSLVTLYDNGTAMGADDGVDASYDDVIIRVYSRKIGPN